MSYRALIIDDEVHGRENIAYMIGHFQTDLEVVGESDNLKDSLEKIEGLKPEIIFLDIHIGDEIGFDLLKDDFSYKPAVIIVSGHSEYGIRAVKSGVVDYLLKPISLDDLNIAVSKAKIFVDHQREIKKAQHHKENVDQLLENIFPGETLTELMESGKVEPKVISGATVVFADFKGFTFIAENMSSIGLIHRLDHYFVRFDEIVKENHLDKIKTMGDGYLFAGGLHGNSYDDAINCIKAAVSMQEFVNQMNKHEPGDNRSPWELRIGIHTGEVVTGIIGKSKLAYDIWGDTVNYANRLQSICKPGKVAISSTTASMIKGKIEFESGGHIKAKNMEEFEVFYIKSY